MSGAFHRFKGLSNIQPSFGRKRSARAVAGEPCIYADHYQEAVGFRHAHDGSCKTCSTDSGIPSLTMDLRQIRAEHQKRTVRFWSNVDITTIDDCWKYEGKAKNGRLAYFWRRPDLKNVYSHHPIRVAIWLSWGDYGNTATQSLCGERRCCNPLHNLPKHFDAEAAVNANREALQERIEAIQAAVAEYHQPVLVEESPIERMLESKVESTDFSRLVDQTFGQLAKGTHISFK